MQDSSGLPNSSETAPAAPNRQARTAGCQGCGIWLSGVALPFLVFSLAILAETLGIAAPLPPRWAFFSLIAVAIVLTTTGCFLSDLPLPAKVGVAVLTVFLFPCLFLLFGFLLAFIFGIEAT
jgi:hypothetical protein